MQLESGSSVLTIAIISFTLSFTTSTPLNQLKILTQLKKGLMDSADIDLTKLRLIMT